MKKVVISNKIKVLIAEDDKAIARALDLKLNHEGFESKIALNGKEAIVDLVQENFDLLILDLVMPQLDGFGVLAEIKAKGIKIPVMVASNLSQTEDIEKAKKMGAVDFFVKSDIPVSEVVKKIKQYFKI